MRRFCKPSVGDIIPCKTEFIMDRAFSERFCRLIDDKNPVHFDNAFAQSKGFPGAIAHGAIGASVFSQLMRSWLKDWPLPGDQIEVKFISPLLIGDVVTASGKCSAIDADAAYCDLQCVASLGRVILTGAVRVDWSQGGTAS